jgi:hypothetical protein
VLDRARKEKAETRDRLTVEKLDQFTADFGEGRFQEMRREECRVIGRTKESSNDIDLVSPLR